MPFEVSFFIGGSFEDIAQFLVQVTGRTVEKKIDMQPKGFLY
jgi:hypothetical protein